MTNLAIKEKELYDPSLETLRGRVIDWYNEFFHEEDTWRDHKKRFHLSVLEENFYKWIAKGLEPKDNKKRFLTEVQDIVDRDYLDC